MFLVRVESRSRTWACSPARAGLELSSRSLSVAIWIHVTSCWRRWQVISRSTTCIELTIIWGKKWCKIFSYSDLATRAGNGFGIEMWLSLSLLLSRKTLALKVAEATSIILVLFATFFRIICKLCIIHFATIPALSDSSDFDRQYLQFASSYHRCDGATN